MLFAVPLTDALFKHRGFAMAVRHIASTGDFSGSSIVKAAGVSPKTAWIILKTLRKTEHLSDGRFKWIDKDFITVNLRDVAVDALFRFTGTRQFLYLKLKEDISLSEAAKRLSLSYSTVKKIVALLRKTGILGGDNSVREELLRKPESPLELIPRKEHRRSVMFFLGESRSEDPVFMHGDASWGLETLEIDLLSLTRKVDVPEYIFLMEDLIQAASATSAAYGFKFNLSVATYAAWFGNKLATTPNRTISDAADGICIRGSPPSDEALFSYVEGAVDEERINDLLADGLIVKTKSGFAYTDKAITILKKKPVMIKETVVEVRGVKVRAITASPTRHAE